MMTLWSWGKVFKDKFRKNWVPLGWPPLRLQIMNVNPQNSVSSAQNLAWRNLQSLQSPTMRITKFINFNQEITIGKVSNKTKYWKYKLIFNFYFSLNSNFNTLKSKIKAAFVAPAQLDKYRKSSMTKQLKNKFKNKEERQSENLKLRSHSHGALPSLDEFSQVKHSSEIEDDINGIWSASQLQASKQAKENQNSSIAKIKKSADNANTAKVRFSRVSGSKIEILYEYHSVGCHTQKLYYLVCKWPISVSFDLKTKECCVHHKKTLLHNSQITL